LDQIVGTRASINLVVKDVYFLVLLIVGKEIAYLIDKMLMWCV